MQDVFPPWSKRAQGLKASFAGLRPLVWGSGFGDSILWDASLCSFDVGVRQVS